MTPLGAPGCRIENGHYLLKMKGLNDLINSRNFIFYVTKADRGPPRRDDREGWSCTVC